MLLSPIIAVYLGQIEQSFDLFHSLGSEQYQAQGTGAAGVAKEKSAL